MVASLESLHFHVAEEARDGPGIAARPPHAFDPELAGKAGAEATAPGFTSNEAAARYFLDELLQRDERPALRSIVEPERPERVPGLVVENERDLKLLGTHQVRFGQTHRGIPVFAAGAVVELTADRELVSVNADLDEVTVVDPVESVSRAEALARVRRYTGVDIP